ncbi:MAG: hypothetical protein L0H78_19560, partial [Humibacillus sp.]|nr:hypothetical protein [Humibacillus sp.]
MEKVAFASDRRISRRSSIEFRIRDDAPILQLPPRGAGAGDDWAANSGEDADQATTPGYWLVPLSVMRRRTLVGLDLRDETGSSLRLLGLRFTQKLDESMLRAAAMLGEPTLNGALPPELDAYVRRVISGNYDEVKQAKQDYHEWQNAKGDKEDMQELPSHIAELDRYFDNVLFAAVLERMWHNFTLYVMLPTNRGRHRLLQLAFEEQVTWNYQIPSLDPPGYRHRSKQGDGPSRDVLSYFPSQRVNAKDTVREKFGFRTTRVRFLTPSAENCASYHFELTAPTGLGISDAAFLAGRPNDQEEKSTSKPSWDRVVNPGQTVGLHAVEIPNGSLCRAQVDLRIPSRGWLSTLTVSVLAITIVMVTVAYHARLLDERGQWTVNQVTNIVLLLVTVTAGAATYVAQHQAGAVASRMVSKLRLFGMAALAIPSMAAVLLIYLRGEPVSSNKPLILGFLIFLTVLCGSAAASLGRAWVFTYLDEGRCGRPSPWDMSSIDDPAMQTPGRIRSCFLKFFGAQAGKTAEESQDAPLPGRDLSFDAYSSELGFTKKAIGVASAEGWHEVYGWNDHRHPVRQDWVRQVGDFLPSAR